MNACQTCSGFFHIAVSPRDEFPAYERDLNIDERIEIEHSAQTCELCRLILSGLGGCSKLEDYDQGADHILDRCGEQLSIKTWTHLSQFKVDKKRITSFDWELLINGMRTSGLPRCYCYVWADQSGLAPDGGYESTRDGASSFDGIVDRPPDIHYSPEETAGLTQRLLNNCLEHHTSCGLSVTQQEESVELPSRLISLQNKDGVLSAKLVETKGLKGTYCALSHCWGSQDKHPLKTTRGNISNYLDCIPWNHLPSTFQDVLNLVSALGLKYLWVDSLCIIQDDKRDWEHEVMRMASVYRKAVLVIAAANSKDSTEGLEGPRPQLPPPMAFRCPITVHNGSDQSIQQTNIVQISADPNFAVQGPLRERAWAFQEWYLGQRKVFFTSKGIKWKCNEAEVDARGHCLDLGLYETSSWISCLDQYSDKRLTIPSDRIPSLLGIVAALMEERDDSFATEFAVWEHGLAEQLLWRHSDTPRSDLPSLPSWCWAATGGSKHWVIKLYQELFSAAEVNQNSQTVALTKSGSLSASGLLIRVRAPSSCFRDCCLAGFGGYFSPESRMLPGHCGEKDCAERFPIHHADSTRSVLGLGVFDNNVHPSECFCFVLTFEKRHEEDSSYDISEPGGSETGRKLSTGAENPESEFEKGGVEGSVCNDSDVQSTDGSNSAYRQEDEHACLDLGEVRMSSGVYWSLLLRPIDDTLMKFRRVGMALIWPRALTEIESEVKVFEII